MQNWETLIAQRTEAHRESYKPQRIEDPVKRSRAIYEKSPRRLAMHKAWEQSEAGKKSMHDRGERYRHTEKGVKNSRKKAMAYYYAHKDDPDFKAKRAARQRKYRAEAKAKKNLLMSDGNLAA